MGRPKFFIDATAVLTGTCKHLHCQSSLKPPRLGDSSLKKAIQIGRSLPRSCLITFEILVSNIIRFD